MTTVLLDSHVAYWWSAEPQRLSMAASQAIEHADELAVAAISWFELAWLAEQERIQLAIPVLSWLQQLAEHVRTVGITPSVAASAVAADGCVMPLTLRTYWRAAAAISTGVAGGCSPRSSVMLRHMPSTIGAATRR